MATPAIPNLIDPRGWGENFRVPSADCSSPSSGHSRRACAHAPRRVGARARIMEGRPVAGLSSSPNAKRSAASLWQIRNTKRVQRPPVFPSTNCVREGQPHGLLLSS